MTDEGFRSAINDLAASVFALEEAVKRLEQRLTALDKEVRGLRRLVLEHTQRPLEQRRLEQSPGWIDMKGPDHG